MKEPIVKNYRGLKFLRWWRHTLKSARKKVRDRPTAQQAMKTSMAAFGALEEPVFILGCPRSGTTYLGNLLEAMPGASYYFEPPILKYYARPVFEGRVSRSQSRRFYRNCCRSLLLIAPGTGPRFVEKNPNHTWVAEALYHAFPDARFVVISRDGRDTALSLSRKPWHLSESAATGKREPGGYLYGPFPHFYIEEHRRDEFLHTSNMHRCAWIWRRHAEQIEHLKQTLPTHCQFHISYENLVLQPAETLGSILDFIDENDERTRRSVFDAARAGHTSSLGRWKKDLKQDDLKIIEREAGQMLERFGYAT